MRASEGAAIRRMHKGCRLANPIVYSVHTMRKTIEEPTHQHIIQRRQQFMGEGFDTVAGRRRCEARPTPDFVALGVIHVIRWGAMPAFFSSLWWAI